VAGSFQDHLSDLFAPLHGVMFRKMFGGLGIFKEGLMFALVADDVLYLKAGDTTSPAFVAEGSGQFIYSGMPGKVATMPYWQIPERLLDEPAEFAVWARSAFAVAERAQKQKSKKTGRKSKS
jgi:DNA transformation protein